MKKICLLFLMAVMSAGAVSAAQPTVQVTPSQAEARLLRFPATNGSDVVFSYAGDLFTVPITGGQARRLTSHIGYEMFAKYSPDGTKIAFTGEYDGNREVYLIPAQGGEPKRLTYTSTNSRDDLGDRMGPNNIVMAWSPDGDQIVYRNRIGDGFPGKLWTVSPEGGMPTEVPLPEGGFCSFSPDGTRMAYNRVFREFRTWKYYRGGMADDVWIYDTKAKKVEDITDNPAQDIIPMWVGNDIFFASDRDMTMNIFVYNTLTKTTEKVTDYTDYDVKFPSTDGHTIVYEHAGYLYRLDPKTRQSEQIHITLSSDDIYARAEQKNVAKDMSSASMSPDGKRVVVTARGEVFDVPVEQGVIRDITRTPGANEREATWSPDGKEIAYISDRTGETEVWLQKTQGGDPEQLTKDNDTYIRTIRWSPDSKSVLYTDRKNRIVEVNVATKAKHIIQENPEGEFYTVNYSPDSKWITYTKSGKNDMNVVYVYNLAENKEYPVTEKWYSSSSPAFSSDGKYLIFSSERDFNPIYSRIEWDYAYTTMGGIYMAMLSKDTPSPLLPKDETVVGTESGQTTTTSLAAFTKNKDAKANKAEKDADKKDSDNNAVTVKIDPEGIADRIIKLPVRTGNYSDFYSDGKKVWYSAMWSTKVFDLEKQKEDTYADGSMDVPMGKKVLFMKDNGIYVTDFGGGKASLDQKVDLSRLTATVDYSQEWPQIFDEVWRAFRDGFYESNMHGVDWNAMKAKYSVFLPYVKTRLDLNYVIGAMISEMACGHAYVTTGDKPEAPRIQMGLLGAKISRDKSGYFRIDEILPGAPYSQTLKSPLAEPGIGVKEGDYITAIDGVKTSSVDNIYELLSGKAGVLTELTVNTSASEGGKKIIVKPIADEYPLYHYQWVQNNIRTVEKASGGKVGYIYIPDMGVDGLNEFARYYYPQLDKEALIVDDRANGGGNVSPMIIERLQREAYRMTMSRTSTKTGTVPEGAFHGPKVLLINKYSASDGDLFPWSFRATNLGKIVGTRTWGGIIGISGSLPYMDNTDVRVPFFTNYDAKTGKWIVENHGVDPDYLIDNDPVKEFNGEDQQLEKAVEVAMEQLKDYKPLPGVPSARTYKDLGLPER